MVDSNVKIIKRTFNHRFPDSMGVVFPRPNNMEIAMTKSSLKHHITLTQQINHAFLAPKGYDGYGNMQSHDGRGIYDSYIRHSKGIASGITQQNFQVSFVSKYGSGV